jgi:hypothetical protein
MLFGCSGEHDEDSHVVTSGRWANFALEDNADSYSSVSALSASMRHSAIRCE